MSTDRETTRVVRSWLRTPIQASADRVLDGVIEGLDSTPQRRATAWVARSTPFLNNTPMRLGIAAAALLALVFVGLRLLPDRTPGGPIATEAASPSPTATASEGVWDPFAPLDEGRNERVSGGVQFSIDVPAGWRNTEFEGMINYSTAHGGHYPWIGFLWAFDSVADDPCAASATPVGPTVDDLANGLTTIPGTDASEPSDTTIGGIQARYVELTIDDDIGCVPTSFWLYGPDSAWPNSIDSTIRVWVFELDGTRYVIHSDLVGGNTDAAQMIVDIVESIEFQQP
jgi:hypothetical protein